MTGTYLTCSRCGNNDISLGEFTIPDSPLPDLTTGGGRSNSITDAALVKTAVAQAELLTVSLTKDIGRLSALTTDLKHRLDMLNNYVEAHRKLLNPFRWLPFELISKIFILSFPPPQTNLERYNFTRAVIIPGQVCRRWRDIALSTPYLWSFITVNLSALPEICHTPVISWLSRSGGYPLSILFTATWSHYMPFEFEQRLQPALSSSHRWKHISMSVALARRESFRTIKGKLAMLESLRLGQSNESSSEDETIDIFIPAPKLTSLHLFSPVGPGVLIIPWKQITELTLTGHAVKMMPLILSRCSNIVKCSAIFPRELRSVIEVVRKPHVGNTSLRSLELDFNWHDDDGINYLRLPSLSDLKFSGDLIIVTNLLSRSSCSLTSLHLRATWLQGNILPNILGLSPALETFELSGNLCCALTASVLMELTVNPGPHLPLVPNLRHLSLDQPPFDDPEGYNVLARMVESRFRLDNDVVGLDSAHRIARFESVRVPVHVLDGYIAPETAARFSALREEGGLDIELPYYYDGPVNA